jgi:hypothetical protein
MNAQEAKQLSVENIPTFIQNDKDDLQRQLEGVYSKVKISSEKGFFQTFIQSGYRPEVTEQLLKDGYEIIPANTFEPNGTQIIKWGNFEQEHSNYKNK